MASGIGTNVSVVPGDPLRVGMLSLMLSHLNDNICSLKKRGLMEKVGMIPESPGLVDCIKWSLEYNPNSFQVVALHYSSSVICKWNV